jgi:replicative DNA helicase
LEKAILRKIIRTCTKAANMAMVDGGRVDLLDEVEREVLKIRPSNRSESKTMAELTQDAISKIEQLFNSQGAISGLPTGLNDLDKTSDGLHGGEFLVLAAYPSIGKTALALNMATFNAFKGTPVGIASCEMQPHELVIRAVCSESRVNLFDVRDGRASQADFDRMTVATAKVSSMPMFIENTNGMTIGEIRAIARRLVQRHGIRLLVVDYIQLISNPDADSREQEVSSISKGLKAIAMEHNIPVIGLSQLNDDGQLRESRAIGQDADSIWKLELDGEKLPSDQPVICRIDKNRNGPVGKVPLLFRKQFTRFESAAKIPPLDA